MTLAWHTAMAPRWLDPQEHDGTATPDNFLMALHDALDQELRARRSTIIPPSPSATSSPRTRKSATFRLREGIKFHNGEPVTPQDVKFSYENYRGALADVFKEKTEAVEIVDDRTVRFLFKEPFLDFLLLFGTGNVTGAGWVVPAKYYQQVGPDGFKQKPIGAGPYKLGLARGGREDRDRGLRATTTGRSTSSNFTMVAVPEAATRVAMLERGEADIIYSVPGELIDRVKKHTRS